MKSGFVMLAGRSNVGKSTLLNALVGSKVAIVTPKPQTTRHPIRGILHDTRGQLVFVDTPGVFLGKKDKVSKRLNELVKESLVGVDVVVYVIDPTREYGAEEEFIERLLKAAPTPLIVVINKIDEKNLNPARLQDLRGLQIGQSQTIEISALKRRNLNLLIDALFTIVPDGPPYYPELQLTDIGHNEWLEELIREKIFLALEQEVPYSIKVSLDNIETRPDGSRFLEVTIWTTADRYKAMIIGSHASMLKRIGTASRKEIETVTGAKVFLSLNVKVDPKWQDRFV
ncbi:MAG: GTPase Era [Patescibacteria group bacterium]